MTRNQMIYALETYWEKFFEDHPEETGDIPGAIEYYHTLTDYELKMEYEDHCN